MKIAREQYIESYSVEDYKGTSMNELRVLYLIAEISRRMRDKEQAKRYFSKVIEKQSLFNEPKILEMAKDQWQRMREEKESS